jgi:type II secretion system protein I
MSLRNRRGGFTLLEVIVALMILVISMTAILTVQDGTINAVSRAKQISQARLLAKNQMIEAEFIFANQTFEEIEKEKSGKFEEEDFQDFTWKRIVKEVHIPDLFAIAQTLNPDKDSQNQMTGGDVERIQMITKKVTAFLSKSIREVTVEIGWLKGGKPQTISVSQYMINLGGVFGPDE